MVRKILLAGIATALAASSAPTGASAQYLVAAPAAVVVPNVVSDDVVAVAEPVYYAPVPVQQTYVTYRPTYVSTVSDAIVTPYGYTPVYGNGFYQGYSYAPMYAFNPYYAGVAYGNGVDPLAASVVGAVSAVASRGGDVSGPDVLAGLIGGLVASQSGPAYVPVAQTYAYPVYTQQYVAPAYVPVAPAYVIYGNGDGGWHRWHGDRGEHRGWWKHHGDDGD